MRLATSPPRWGAPRKRRRAAAQNGQALVEFALVGSLLVVLALGITDFGRVLGTNATIVNAAREAAREITQYEHEHGSEPLALTTFATNVAIAELGCSTTPTPCLSPQAAPAANCPASPTSLPWDPGTALDPSLYPPSTAPDTGYVYTCSWHSSADGKQHVEVVIAWRASLYTPLMQNITGQPHLHGIADGTEP